MKQIREKIKQYYQKQQAEKIGRLRSEFLPEAMEIVEKPISPAGHFVVIVTAVLVIFFLVWSVVGKMDEVVTARGKVVTVNGIQNVQTINGGMIEKICVEEGQQVKAGEVLVYLDSSVQEITLQNTSQSLELLKLENYLLEQLAEGKDISGCLQNGNLQIKTDNKDNLQAESSVEEINASISLETEGKEQQQIFQYVSAIEKEYETQKAELDKSLQQALAQVEIEQKALDALAEDGTYLNKQKEEKESAKTQATVEEINLEKIKLSITYKEEELKDYEKLYEAGAIALAEVEQCRQELELLKKDYEIQSAGVTQTEQQNTMEDYGVEHEIETVKHQYDSQKSAVDRAEKNYEQIKKSQESLLADYKGKLSTLIRENENNILALEANQEIQNVSVGEQVLVSPVDGVVKTLEVNTIGGVLTAGQLVATIVPKDAQMIAEVEILNQDIGCIQTGQETAIKLDAYNFQDYGKLEGVMVSISPDAIWDEQKGWIYQGKVSINLDKFKQRNPGLEMTVGMEGTVEVKVDERRILDFFLEPIVEHFDGSLKVR